MSRQNVEVDRNGIHARGRICSETMIKVLKARKGPEVLSC